MKQFPYAVAELGPGDSIGVGLAALLSGASRYIVLDAMAHADTTGNLRVFDELVALFRRQAPIPTRGKFSEIVLYLPDYSFPQAILGREQMRHALADDRIAWLRTIVSGEHPDPSVIDYRVPWECATGADAGSVDFLLSNAVMEHVADLAAAYDAMSRWLHIDGYASHQIDFRSHSLFRAWDGHWACPEWLWALFIGRRKYLLNREPFATHRSLAATAGLQECSCVRVERLPESKHLAKRFHNMDPRDRATSSGYLLLRPNAAG